MYLSLPSVIELFYICLWQYKELFISVCDNTKNYLYLSVTIQKTIYICLWQYKELFISVCDNTKNYLYQSVTIQRTIYISLWQYKELFISVCDKTKNYLYQSVTIQRTIYISLWQSDNTKWASLKLLKLKPFIYIHTLWLISQIIHSQFYGDITFNGQWNFRQIKLGFYLSLTNLWQGSAKFQEIYP